MRVCVIFDVDGTLFDTGEGIRDCARAALQALGVSFPEEKLNLFIGPSLYHSFTQTAGLGEADALKGVELYRARYKTTGIDMSKPYDGVHDLLRRLHESGYVLSVASSKPQDMVEYLLQKYDMRKYFTAVVAAQFGTRSSDKSAYVREAACGERNVMVGDTHFDIDGAHAAGVPAVAAAYGFGARDTLNSADYMADSPADIWEIITKNFSNKEEK